MFDECVRSVAASSAKRMAHGICEVLGESSSVVKMIGKLQQQQPNSRKTVGVMGCRRIFSPQFKLRVLDSYRNDLDCKGNQRATARKYNLHRRQIQKWLQAEDNLRKACTESNSINNNGGVRNMPLSPPLSSPSSSSPSPSAAMVHHDNHHHHHQSSGAPATSPSLNLGLARLRGDELAMRRQPPPPPPPPPPSRSAQVAAAQALAVAATTQASYRFHHSAPQPVPAAGYPHFGDRLPIQPPHHYAAGADYSMLYQPAFQPTPAPSHHRYTIHYNYQQNVHPEAELHYQQPRSAAAMFTEVKTERPDSAAAATPCETAAVDQPRLHHLKREHSEEHYQRRSSSSGSTVTSGSPSPSHLDLECLPPSPRDSERSAASSPDSEMGCDKRSSCVARKRKSYSLNFKLNVLNAFHRDTKIGRNQRATARKFNIDRRQVQKWLGQENELRGVVELCDSNSRQRLGPLHEASCFEEAPATTTIPVDLRTPTTTEPGQMSPQSSSSHCQYYESSPSTAYVDSSLTPPYSNPGCSLMDCCQESQAPKPTTYYPDVYCFSPAEVESAASTNAEPTCNDANRSVQQEVSEDRQPVQEAPLCLVKPKSNRDAILFKPYLDNPVSKPAKDEPANKPSNNDCQQTWSMVQQQFEAPHARSAFVRYPTAVHFS